MKEKIDRQLAGQSSSTPFMNIKDQNNSQKVTFYMHESLDNAVDSLPQWWANWQLKIIIRINSLSPKYIKVDEEDNQEIITYIVLVIKIVVQWVINNSCSIN